MKRPYLYFIAALLCAVTMEVQASSEPLEKTVTPAPPAEINWAGPYLGINAGVVWTDYGVSKYRTGVDLEEQFYEAVAIPGEFTAFIDFPVPGHSDTDWVGIGGGQIGYNLQFGHFVVGAEGGFSGAFTETLQRTGDFVVNPIGFIGVIQLGDIVAETKFNSWRRAETNWNGYLGGHLGFAWWRLLFYGNGGAAFTDLRLTSTDRAHTDFFEECDMMIVDGCDGGSFVSQPNQDQIDGTFLGGVTNTKGASEDDVVTGWYAGGGLQYALNDVVRVGVEYRHCDFGDKTLNFHSSGPVFPGRTNFDLESDQVTFRVNIMLGRLGNFRP